MEYYQIYLSLLFERPSGLGRLNSTLVYLYWPIGAVNAVYFCLRCVFDLVVPHLKVNLEEKLTWWDTSDLLVHIWEGIFVSFRNLVEFSVVNY